MPYGQDSQISIAFQNSFGTAANVASLFQIPFLSEDVGLEKPELISQNLNSRYDEGDAYAGPRQVAGTLEAEAQPIALGMILGAAINAPVSALVSSITLHTFTPRTSDFDVNVANNPMSYYKWLADPGSAQYFIDCIAGMVELSVTNGELLTVRTEFMGGKRTIVSSDSFTLDEGRRWSWDVTSVSIGAAANADMRDFTFTFDEGLEPIWTLDGSLDAGRVKRVSPRTVRLNGTMVFEDQTELTAFVAETIREVIITMTGTVETGDTGENDELVITIPSFKYLEFKPPIPGPGIIEVPFVGKGEYNSGSGNSVEITLQNTQQTYA